MAGSADKPPIDAILQKVLEAVPFQLIAEGDAETILANQLVKEVYLGHEFRL